MSGTFIIGQDRFKDVTCKLGNMRKAQEFTLYPYTKGETTIVIQADNRIARVDLVSGKALLSNGKGGHQGTVKLLPQLGATLVDVPADILASIKAQIGYVDPIPSLESAIEEVLEESKRRGLVFEDKPIDPRILSAMTPEDRASLEASNG